MPRFRVSLAWLMTWVIFLAVVFASVRNVSPLWAGILFFFVLGILCTSILGAVTRRGSSRTAWLGFALFGVSYLVCSLPSTSPTGPIDLAPTNGIIDGALERFGLQPLYTAQQTYLRIGPSMGLNLVSIAPYRQIGHSILTILFALLGAIVGRFFASRDDGRRIEVHNGG